jgi:hypothetical protein
MIVKRSKNKLKVSITYIFNMTSTPCDIVRTMDFSTASDNFDLLSALQPHQKLIVINSNRLEYDNRWAQSMRRRLNGDSKYDIEEPIMSTLSTMIEHQPEKCKTLIPILRQVLQLTYPEWTDIQMLLEKFYDKNFIEKHDDSSSNVSVDGNKETTNRIISNCKLGDSVETNVIIPNCQLNDINNVSFDANENFTMNPLWTDSTSWDQGWRDLFYESNKASFDDFTFSQNESPFSQSSFNEFRFGENEPLSSFNEFNFGQNESLSDRLSQLEAELVHVTEENRVLKEEQTFLREQIYLLAEDMQEMRSNSDAQTQSDKFQFKQLKTMITQYHKKMKKTIKKSIDEVYDNMDENLNVIEEKLEGESNKIKLLTNQVDDLVIDIDCMDDDLLSIEEDLDSLTKINSVEVSALKNICDVMDSLCDDLEDIDEYIMSNDNDKEQIFKDMDKLYSDSEVHRGVLLKLVRKACKKNVNDN